MKVFITGATGFIGTHRELGIAYTPVHVMLREEIASLKEHGLE